MNIVSDKLKQVYFLAEKCASTSVRNYLLARADEEWQRIEGPPKWESKYINYQCFTFARHPYRRAVSYWRYRFETGITHADFGDFVLGKCKDGCYLDIKSCGEWYSAIPSHRCKVIKVGTLDCTMPDLPRDNTTKHEHWTTYFTSNEILHAVNKWAKNDFKLYTYPFYVDVGNLPVLSAAKRREDAL